jgi:hypothetical protein
MNSLWSLPALARTVPMYASWRMRHPGRRKPLENTISVPEPSVDITTAPESVRKQTRVMQWISTGEFLSILTKFSDLIVIDLRANAQSAPFSVPTASVLPVSPNEMDKTLEWLPEGMSVVFYGASNLSIFMIETSGCMEGSAPLYVLEGDPGLEEVA